MILRFAEVIRLISGFKGAIMDALNGFWARISGHDPYPIKGSFFGTSEKSNRASDDFLGRRLANSRFVQGS